MKNELVISVKKTKDDHMDIEMSHDGFSFWEIIGVLSNLKFGLIERQNEAEKSKGTK